MAGSPPFYRNWQSVPTVSTFCPSPTRLHGPAPCSVLKDRLARSSKALYFEFCISDLRISIFAFEEVAASLLQAR